MTEMPKTLFSIRGVMGCCHLLIENREATIIDAGLVGESFQILRVLRRHGLELSNLKAILLTHGHIDHTGNLNWLRANSTAQIYAHPSEQSHIDGSYPYTGVNRWCGYLEGVARLLINYKSAKIDLPLNDNQLLPLWGGLRVIHLPGHTEGHCGFFSERYNLLFSGDMFASYFFNIHRPPAILNSAPQHFSRSFQRMRDLNPALIIPSHYDFFDGQLHRRRFDCYYRRWTSTAL